MLSLEQLPLRGPSGGSGLACDRVSAVALSHWDARGCSRAGRSVEMLRKAGQRPDSASSLAQELKASGAILDLLPIATCICDAQGRIVQYNRSAVELWGREPDPGQTHD